MSEDKEPQGGGTNPWMKSLFIWAGILLALVLFGRRHRLPPALGQPYPAGDSR